MAAQQPKKHAFQVYNFGDSSKWAEQTKAHADYKDGTKLTDATGRISKLLEAVDTDQEFAKFMDHTGLGDHPAIFRFVDRVAKVFADHGKLTLKRMKDEKQQAQMKAARGVPDFTYNTD